MARITRVKKAQQRYETVPVLDADGNPVTTPVLRKDGTPKTTKKGKSITRRVTVADKTNPLPNHKCDKCGTEIKVGDPYKWIAPKSGPYGGTKKFRCASCPDWHLWDYNFSRGAQVARIQYEYSNEIAAADDVESIRSALESAANEIEGLGDEAEESANNIVDGFGHETYQSEELMQQAEDLRSWAQELAEWEPEGEEPTEDDLDLPDDAGDEEKGDALTEAIESWLEDVRSSADDALNECPI